MASAKTPPQEHVGGMGMSRDLQTRLRDADAGSAREPDDERRRLLHDLEVHQLELEMQNQELRATQVQLEQSRGRLADLYEFAPVVYITLDAEARIVEANLTAASYFGLERGKLVGRSLAGLAAPADRASLRDHVRRCFVERVRVESEISFSVRRRPGVTAQMISVPLFDRDGAVIGCKTTLTDISALKRAQAKLQFLSRASAVLASSFDYRATLIEVARLAVPLMADICVVDLADESGVIARLEIACANPATAARLAPFRTRRPQADEATALGKAIRTRRPLLFPDCSPVSLASVGEGFDHEALIRASGAQSILVMPLVARERVLGVITLIAAESGHAYSASDLSTASDLATHAALAIDNARLYERVQQAVRTREEVLSFVSHDLRNPLMGVLLTAETLLNRAPVEERRRGWKQLERIRRGAQQMRHMIDDLLDAASLESGHLTVHPAGHDVARLFDDTWSMLAPLAAEKGVALRFEAPADPLVIHCDRERVVQVLSNLIGNAIKFTPQAGSITVTAERAGPQALLAVRDTGPGISAVMRPRIFERFWQAAETARKGSGLGLYIAKGLVEAHGGAIWVDCPSEGGSRFSFTLPLAAAAGADAARKPASVPASSEAKTPSPTPSP
jgi:PAS domain S-box-containing protein